MKAKIIGTEWVKEYEGKHGKLHLHKIKYADKVAYYSSKSKDQKKFEINKDAEFTEEERVGKDNNPYLIIKPIYNQGQSNFGKKVKQEQSKYSGFAMSYAKDLVVNDKIGIEEMYQEAEKMINWMVTKDKQLQS